MRKGLAFVAVVPLPLQLPLDEKIPLVETCDTCEKEAFHRSVMWTHSLEGMENPDPPLWLLGVLQKTKVTSPPWLRNRRNMRQQMAEIIVVHYEKLILPLLDIFAIMSDKKSMRPDIDGWVPLQRLLARCESVLGNALKEACELTQTKKKLEFLKKQMGGIEIKEQKTKNGIRLMYRMPEDASPDKNEVR